MWSRYVSKTYSASSRTRNGRVQPPDIFVRRDQHQHSQSLTDQPVHHVQQPRESLPDPLPRVGGEELARVLEDDQPPAFLVVVGLEGGGDVLEKNAQEVSGVRPEE